MPKWLNAKSWKWIYLLICMICGMGLNAAMTLSGGWLKAYNDIPSLVGYLSCLLLVYKVGCTFVNKCFVWLDKIGYELYLVYSLTYTISFKLLLDKLPIYVVALIALCFAIVLAKGFSMLVRKI